MKRMSNPMLRGKATLLVIAIAAGTSMFMTSCKKDDKDSNSQSGVTEAEAAQVVSTAVTNGGVAAQTQQATIVATAFLGARHGAKAADCGWQDAGNFEFASDANAATTYSIAYDYTVNLTCATDGASYQSFQFAFNAKTAFATSKFALSDTSSADFNVTGLDDASANLVFNQKFDHNGTFTSKDGSASSFHSVLKYTATDVTVSKSTLQIVSGTAAVTISGTTTTGKSFSYAGTITYKGNNKATFTITGGGSFDLTW